MLLNSYRLTSAVRNSTEARANPLYFNGSGLIKPYTPVPGKKKMPGGSAKLSPDKIGKQKNEHTKRYHGARHDHRDLGGRAMSRSKFKRGPDGRTRRKRGKGPPSPPAEKTTARKVRPGLGQRDYGA
jgi:hypothetical protein